MEIKILGICGSPIKSGNTEVFLNEALKAAENTGNVQTELISLAGKEIKDCRHCNWCVTKQIEGKFCSQKDDMVEIYPKVLETDAILLASPVYIGRLSGYLACFLDRLRVFAFGNLYRGKLRNKGRSCFICSLGKKRRSRNNTDDPSFCFHGTGDDTRWTVSSLWRCSWWSCWLIQWRRDG